MRSFKVNAKCSICEKPAILIRNYSGEKYCEYHFRRRIYNSVEREIVKKTAFQKFIGYSYIINLGADNLANIISEILGKIHKDRDFDQININYNKIHTKYIHYEKDKLMRIYSSILKLASEGNIVIITHTADKIAHDYLTFLLTNEINIIKMIRRKRLVFPFSGYLSSEVKLIWAVEELSECQISNYITRLNHRRPTSIYSIIKFADTISK